MCEHLQENAILWELNILKFPAWKEVFIKFMVNFYNHNYDYGKR